MVDTGELFQNRPECHMDEGMLTDYAEAVVERFKNPHFKHFLLSILLNPSSKFKTRNLPSLLEYYNRKGQLPEKLVFAFAALMGVYKDGWIDGECMRVKTSRGEFIMKDDLSVLTFFNEVWQGYSGEYASAFKVAVKVLSSLGL